jgi:hypothetical protein
MTRGRHNLKLGAELDRQQINLLLGIATNGFFVFAPFPASDSFASLLLGQSVQFFQGGGDFNRGIRKWVAAGYAQDEFRLTPRLTLSYGLRYELNTPYTEIRNRMNEWDPGVQSTVMPNAPPGLLFPGDPGVPAGIAPVDYREFMPRVGVAWDPFGNGQTTIRAAYGIFYDGFTNGVGGPLQAPVSALPWTEAYQLAGPGFSLANPYGGQAPPFASQQFVQPATILTVQKGMLPPTPRTGIYRSSALSPRTICWTCGMSGIRVRICRGSSRQTLRSTVPARRPRTPNNGASTPIVTRRVFATMGLSV